MPHKVLTDLYKDLFGHQPETVTRLPGAGSERIYCRMFSPCTPTVIGCVGRQINENRAFIDLCRYFKEKGFNVPEILAVSEDYSSYLQSDLGDLSLFSLIIKGEGNRLLGESLRSLCDLQHLPKNEWHPLLWQKDFGNRLIKWDLNYFKYEFLKPTGTEFDEDLLEDDFERLEKNILEIPKSQWGFMYRDFQSRNIFILDGAPYFIDFQGGRYGPAIYDAVSLLWQAKANLPIELRENLMHEYAEYFCARRGVEVADFLSHLDDILLFRVLQTLGAYGFRGLVEKKAHFIESIRPALKNLSIIINSADEYPELQRVCRILCEDTRFSENNSEGNLTITIFSFSYKKGYPEDFSGNGGGFMFDCRGMHNPGRYAEYKHLTGADKSVIDFLEERGEVQPFLAHAFEIVAPTIETYLRRGFSSLQIGFGCTGGQHRSLYCAEHLADMLHGHFPKARIKLIHREQGIERTL